MFCVFSIVFEVTFAKYILNNFPANSTCVYCVFIFFLLVKCMKKIHNYFEEKVT